MNSRLQFTLITPFCTLGAFIVSLVISYIIGYHLFVWPELACAVICPVATLAAAYFSAPKWRLSVAFIVILLGGYVAWFELRSYYPEGTPKGYEPTMIPNVIAVSTGIITYFILALVDAARGRRMKRTRNEN